MLIDGVAGRDGGGGGGGDSDPCRVSANINNLSVLNKKKTTIVFFVTIIVDGWRVDQSCSCRRRQNPLSFVLFSEYF